MADAPWREPVDVDTAKKRLGVRTDFRDDEIAMLIKAARGMVEDFTGRALVRRTFVEPIAGFGGSPIRLGHAPVHAITAVRYLDGSGQLQDVLGVRVLQLAVGACVFPPVGGAWPAASEGYAEVEFVAGYGQDEGQTLEEVEDCPDQLVQAILLLVGNWFENHEGALVGTVTAELPFGVRELCRSFRPAGIA